MKTKKEKKLIEIKDSPYIYIGGVDIFEGEIDKVCEEIQKIKTHLKNVVEENRKTNPSLTPFEEYKKISIKFERSYEDSDFLLFCEREETDEEFEKRIQAEKNRKKAAILAAKKRKENDEKKQRELYEALKKKYEE